MVNYTQDIFKLPFTSPSPVKTQRLSVLVHLLFNNRFFYFRACTCNLLIPDSSLDLDSITFTAAN